MTIKNDIELKPALSLAEPGGLTARRVLVFEQCGGTWKAVEAELDGTTIVLRGARTSASPADLPGHAGGDTVAVLPELQTSVCRVLDLAGAPADQIEAMVSLRLELELPYPVAESAWACEPRMNGNGPTGQVLLIAAASSEVVASVDALRARGIRHADIEFAPAGLAELVLASDASEETLAVLYVKRDSALLVLVHERGLCYARHIRPPTMRESAPLEEWVAPLAREVNQSLFDYQLRSGHGRPHRLMLAGEGESAALFDTLESQLDLPVEPLELPRVIMASDAVAAQTLLTDYPACLGALLAIHRRWRGEASAAPPLQRGNRGQRTEGWRGRRGLLFALNAGLLVLLLALGAWVRSVQLDAAEELMANSQPILAGLDKLQEEVDILRYEDKRGRSTLDVFLALAEALPPEVKVESIAIDTKGAVTISGKASSVEAASDKAMTALRESKLLVNPIFHGATKEQDGFGFRITCELRGGGHGGGK